MVSVAPNLVIVVHVDYPLLAQLLEDLQVHHDITLGSLLT
jgi:hypothetical protein